GQTTVAGGASEAARGCAADGRRGPADRRARVKGQRRYPIRPAARAITAPNNAISIGCIRGISHASKTSGDGEAPSGLGLGASRKAEPEPAAQVFFFAGFLAVGAAVGLAPSLMTASSTACFTALLIAASAAR